jgi:SAM-dependent methyltransferase
MAIQLNRIVPLGRSFREYQLMFNLTKADLAGKLLDCGGGPASFTAEAIALGYCVDAVDPIYKYSGEQIEQRFWATLKDVIAQIDRTPDDWVWTVHADSRALRHQRIEVMGRFLRDYGVGDRYVTAALPNLPFADNHYTLALCSHLLFLYSDLLSLDFHLASLQELCRVAQEVRVFPLVTLAAQPSPYVAAVCQALGDRGLVTQIQSVGYELQKGGNQMLRIFRCGADHPA